MKIYFKTKIKPIQRVEIYNSEKNAIDLDSADSLEIDKFSKHSDANFSKTNSSRP
jgi:hypothetical protein